MRLLHGRAQCNSIALTPVLLLAPVHAALALLSGSERLWRDIRKPQLSRHLVGCFVLNRRRRGKKLSTQLLTSGAQVSKILLTQPGQCGPDDAVALP